MVDAWLGSAMDIAEEALAKGATGAATGSVVPGIGTLAGGLVGVASALIPHVFGKSAEPILAQAAQAITGATDPNAQIAALTNPANAEMLQKFQAAALQTAQDELDSRLADTQNARQLTSDLAGIKSPLAWEGPIIDFVVLALFGSCVYMVMTHGLPAESAGRDVAVSFLSITGTLAVQVVQYWRGSSSGSASKEMTLRSQMSGKGT